MKNLTLIIIAFSLFYSCKKPVTASVSSDKVEAVKSAAAADLVSEKSATQEVEEVVEVVEQEAVKGKVNDDPQSHGTQSVKEETRFKANEIEKEKLKSPSVSKNEAPTTSTPKKKGTVVESKKTTPPVIEEAIEEQVEVIEKVVEVQKDKKIKDAIQEKDIQKKDIQKKGVQEEVPNKSKTPHKPAMINADHKPFHKLLAKFVSSTGEVDYAGIKSNVAQLDGYLKILEGVNVSALSTSEQLAFWINAYNAYTIKKIVNNYPLKSITDLDGGKPWDVKWINLNGKTLSLNNIENDIIRPQFNEPRIHFAVNCAAKSCPPILNIAYSPGNLNTNLYNSTKAFVNNKKYNQISASSIKVSKIFEWYAKDFGNLIEFINKYSDVKVNADATIEYMDYNWALNN